MCRDGCGQVGERQHVGRREGDRPDMQRARAHRPRQPDVAGAVANHPGRREIEAERLGGGQRHARTRLAVGAGPGEGLHDAVGVIRAEQPQVDVRAVPRHLLDHVLVHLVHVLDAVVAARDAGLVRHHGDRELGPVQRGDRLDGAVEELDAVDRADIPAVGDDRSVTVEQYAWAAHRAHAFAHGPAARARTDRTVVGAAPRVVLVHLRLLMSTLVAGLVAGLMHGSEPLARASARRRRGPGRRRPGRSTP